MKRCLRGLYQPIHDYLDNWCATEFKIRMAWQRKEQGEAYLGEYFEKLLAFEPAPDFSFKLMDHALLLSRRIMNFLIRKYCYAHQPRRIKTNR